jgi:hypothetical protein
MTAEQWTSLVEHALWPAVILVLGIVLHKPIGDFLGAIAGRVTKVSVMSVSLELAVAQPANPPWQGIGGDDIRGLVVAQQVNDSYFYTLREALKMQDSADYFQVDLHRDGEEWLTSRLYIFSYMLSRLKGVRAVVFLATRDNVAGSFLAVAPVDALILGLAAKEPWLRVARLNAEAKQAARLPKPSVAPANPRPGAMTPPQPADMEEWWAALRDGSTYGDPLLLAREFLEQLQRQQQRSPRTVSSDDGWLRLPDQMDTPITWEHASWLNSSHLADRPLRDAIKTEWYVVDNRSWTAEERVATVIATPGDFVALLHPSRRFDRLVDRRSLGAAVGEKSAQSLRPVRLTSPSK